jgi:hypothetical protein
MLVVQNTIYQFPPPVRAYNSSIGQHYNLAKKSISKVLNIDNALLCAYFAAWLNYPTGVVPGCSIYS